jgi:gentisate 1,2-dioxygenase
MHPGDFIVTPSWTFHDHGNPGHEPVVWLDGLDIPMVAFFDAGFAERYPEEVQPESKSPGDAVFCYPYARYRTALEKLRAEPLHPCHGAKLEYRNPVTGAYPMPTIAAFLQSLPSRFEGEPCRSTDGTVYCAVEGRGRSQVGDRVFEWSPRDVFVVPSWTRVSHSADEDAVLFSFSDRPVQQAMGVWRERVSA